MEVKVYVTYVNQFINALPSSKVTEKLQNAWLSKSFGENVRYMGGCINGKRTTRFMRRIH